MSKKTKSAEKKETKRIRKFVTWAPRILTIILIAFMVFGAVGSVLFGKRTAGSTNALLLMLIPSEVLLVLLFISWKYEIAKLVIGIVFIIFAIIYFVSNLGVVLYAYIPAGGMIFLAGILFIIDWQLKRKNKII
jgi:hypothetical protein